MNRRDFLRGVLATVGGAIAARWAGRSLSPETVPQSEEPCHVALETSDSLIDMASQAFGENPAIAVFVDGIGRWSMLPVDNFAMTIDLEDAYQEASKALGKSAGRLSCREKQQAVLNRVLAPPQKREARGGRRRA